MNKTYIEHEEITMLVNAANNLRDKLLIRILFRLGCRVNEALVVGIEDIGFYSGIIIIKHLKERIKLSSLLDNMSIKKLTGYKVDRMLRNNHRRSG